MRRIPEFFRRMVSTEHSIRRVRASKALGLAIFGATVNIFVWAFRDKPHAVWTSSIIAGVLMIGGYLLLDFIENRCRDASFKEALHKATRERTVSIYGLFSEMLGGLSGHLSRLKERDDIRDLRDSLCTFALDRICELVHAGGSDTLSHTRVTLLRPDPDRTRFLQFALRNVRSDPPENRDYRFEIGDQDCQQMTVAGYTWFHFLQEGRPHFEIASIPQYLRDHPDPRERVFHIMYSEQHNKIKSMLCYAVHCRTPLTRELGKDVAAVGSSRSRQLAGMLCLDSDVEGFFTNERWAALEPFIEPLMRLIVVALQLHETLILSTMAVSRAENKPKSVPAPGETMESGNPGIDPHV